MPARTQRSPSAWRDHPVRDAVLARGGHDVAEYRAEECVGHLDQDARAVTRIDVRPRRAAVLEVLQDRQRVNDRSRCVGVALRSAIMPTPQASCSKEGS